MPLDLKVSAVKSVPVGGPYPASGRPRAANTTRTAEASNQAVEYTTRNDSGYVVDWQLPAEVR